MTNFYLYVSNKNSIFALFKAKLVLEDKKYVLKSILSLLLGLLDMIRFVKGNLLESSAQALVNIVNAVGVMGKGIASHFKEAYPNNN